MQLPPAILVAGILALGIAAQWIAWRVRIPAIVLLLAFGLALGQIAPADATGDQDFFFALISLSVGIILFEGGLSLDFREIHGAGGVVIRLVTIGLLLTWLLTAALAHWIASFTWPIAMLLGAILTVSGPTVVLPLLRHVQPVRRIGSLAKWEGIVNDPIGAVLAALVFEVIVHFDADQIRTADALKSLGATMLLGVVLGACGALFLLVMLRRYWTPDYLQNPIILAFVTVIFAISNAIQHESGLVSVTVMGVVLANQRAVAIRHIVEFKENLAVLLISTLFIVLTRRLQIDVDSLASLGWGSLVLAALLIVFVRPASVFLSTLGCGLSWQERVFLSWNHPRGIVAAAVGSIFALDIQSRFGPGSPLAVDATRLELVVFIVIAATVVTYGMSLAPLARWLGLSGADPQGILFAGASRTVRAIATSVQDEGFSVLLVDTNRRNVAKARMTGLPVIYANVGSEYVQEEIDLGGIGRILSMTPNDEVNALAGIGFSERFGWAEVYQLAAFEGAQDRPENTPAHSRGRTLFDRPATFEEIEQRLAAGDIVKKTQITDDFSYDAFLTRYGESALILFIVQDGNKLLVATEDKETPPKPGDKIIALVRDDDTAETADSTQETPSSIG